jgi:hypothetical protein
MNFKDSAFAEKVCLNRETIQEKNAALLLDEVI